MELIFNYKFCLKHLFSFRQIYKKLHDDYTGDSCRNTLGFHAVHPLFLPDYIQNVTSRNLLEYSYAK
jgi:hypothetical protein